MVVGPGVRPSSARANTPDVSLSRHLDAVAVTFGVGGADADCNRLTVAAIHDLPVKFNVDYIKAALADTAIGHQTTTRVGWRGVFLPPAQCAGHHLHARRGAHVLEDREHLLSMGMLPIATVGGVKVITARTSARER